MNVVDAEFATPFPRLRATLLDFGEAATIALALQESASFVLMDEAKGRRVARDVYGIAVIGSGRVLIEAKRRTFIREARPLIERVQRNGIGPRTQSWRRFCDKPGNNKAKSLRPSSEGALSPVPTARASDVSLPYAERE